ncbi:MAG: sigma-70 family RNA polymerase sigma factor [Candidatus Nanopelagicales bacterium]
MNTLLSIKSYRDLSDKSLLDLYINGEKDALSEIFLRHKSKMKSVAYRITKNDQDAEDVVQNSMISIMKNAHKFRGESAVTTWIYKIVSNAAIDKLRALKSVQSLENINELIVNNQEINNKDFSLDLMNALNSLPINQREVVFLIDFEGFSIKDAAKKLKCAPGTIKSRCHRAHEKLAKQLRLQN